MKIDLIIRRKHLKGILCGHEKGLNLLSQSFF